jgi:LysM repeat protein
MNTPNPLMPQSSLTDQKPRNKSNVYIAVFAILALHVVVLGGLLLQGCKDRPPTTEVNPNSLPPLTNTPPVDPLAFNPGATSSIPVTPFNPASTDLVSVPPVVVPVLPVVIPPPSVPMVAGAEHLVAKGETFATIAKKYGVSVDAITKANPGVNPRKLQLKQKLVIPEHGNGGAAPTASLGMAVPDPASYEVKKGDTLTKIATSNGTTIKQLRALNSLKTDQLKIGQKLKVPVKAATPVIEPAPLVPSPVAPVPVAPTSTSYVTPLPGTPVTR